MTGTPSPGVGEEPARFVPELPIRTERLLLRPLNADDVDAVFAYRSRADVCRFLPNPPMNRDDVDTLISDNAEPGLVAGGRGLLLAVVERESDQVIGDVVLFWRSQPHRQGEVGYAFSPEYAGQGFASEAVRELLRLGFAELGLHRIIGRVYEPNHASSRLLERVGMQLEGRLRQDVWNNDEWQDVLVLGLLAEEWLA